MEREVIRPAWMDWLYASKPVLGDLSYDLYFADEEKRNARMTQEQETVYQAQAMLQYDLMFGKQYAAPSLYEKALPPA